MDVFFSPEKESIAIKPSYHQPKKKSVSQKVTIQMSRSSFISVSWTEWKSYSACMSYKFSSARGPKQTTLMFRERERVMLLDKDTRRAKADQKDPKNEPRKKRVERKVPG